MAQYQSLSDEDLEKVTGGLADTDIVINGYYTVSGDSSIICQFQYQLPGTSILCKIYWWDSANKYATYAGRTTTNYHTSDFTAKVSPNSVNETASLENPYAKATTPTTPPTQPTGGVQ